MRIISSSQIHDYQTCPWKYYLGYILKVAWPAPITPYFQKLEEEAELGKLFHLVVHRSIQGLALPAGHPLSGNPEIAYWVQNFGAHSPIDPAAKLYSEMELTTLFAEHIWLGKFDCIALTPAKITIFDWKTARKSVKPDWLLKSPQSRLYPFLLAMNLEKLSGISGRDTAYSPEDIEMVYWFPNFPEDAIQIAYSTAQFDRDKDFLASLALKLSAADPADYPQTLDEKNCARCRFQTRCHRGASSVLGTEEEPEWLEEEPALPDAEVDIPL